MAKVRAHRGGGKTEWEEWASSHPRPRKCRIARNGRALRRLAPMLLPGRLLALTASAGWKAPSVPCPYHLWHARTARSRHAYPSRARGHRSRGPRNVERLDRRQLHITGETAQLHARRGIRKLVRRLRIEDDDGLTGRERDLIELLRDGLTDRQIAQSLNIGVRSAETYVTRVPKKLGHSRAELRPTPRDRHPSGLSPREREMAELLSQGLSDRMISERLGIALRTAESHVSAVLRKSGLTSREQLRD